MMGPWEALLSAARFVPHGYVLPWRPDLVALHVVADGLIALAFFSIPAAIYCFVRRRADFEHRAVAILFVTFITACGITHLVSLLTLWFPFYGFQGLVKVAAAALSVTAAIVLWPLIPRALALPSAAALRRANARLEAEVRRRDAAKAALRRAHDDLERRVAKRTFELAESNRRLRAEIAERRRVEDDARRLAVHDSLTGLPNRRLLEDRLAQAIARARRDGTWVALMLLDLDHFKDVNDTLGHPAGDQLLCAAAKRIAATIRQSDTLARLGGDEFALVQVAFTGPDGAAALARKVIDVLAAPFELGEETVHVGASVGIALFPHDGADPETLVKHADLALYRAKADGRHRFCFFVAAMNDEVMARKQVEQELRSALARGELRLAYQPVVELGSGRIRGVEALARWHRPGMDDVPPARFIPVAEACGLIRQLGRHVLFEACRQAGEWKRGGRPITVAVNVSAVQLRHDDLPSTVRAALAQSGLEPHELELEITESVFTEPAHDSHEGCLRELAALGVGLAIDDFGTGFSCLAYLRRHPVNKIKINRAFIRDVAKNASSREIVRALIALGHSLGKRVVAEGVETEDQLDVLFAERCDQAQGFLLALPRPAPLIAPLLSRNLRLTLARPRHRVAPNGQSGTVRPLRASAIVTGDGNRSVLR